MKFKALCIAILLALTAVVAHDHIKSPTIPSTGYAGLDKFRLSRIAMFTDDFGQLNHYRAANAALPSQADNRVVFFGDSIIEYWKLADSFPGQSYINRGIAGQTTAQMLLRFQQDVIALHPKTVIILGSNNDIAGNTGPMQPQDSEHNYQAMAEMAKANNIAVVFASVLPVYNYNAESKENYAQRPLVRIKELNNWLKDYSARNQITYVDYFSALIDTNGMLTQSLSADGLHPNAEGYKVMAPLTQAALAR